MAISTHRRTDPARHDDHASGGVDLFGAVNRIVEPVVRNGWLAPAPVGAGLVLLETTGRRSGRRRSTPLLSVRVGPHLIVGTIRGSSDWMANLAEDPNPVLTSRGRSGRVEVDVRAVDPLGSVALLRHEDDPPLERT